MKDVAHYIAAFYFSLLIMNNHLQCHGLINLAINMQH